MDRSFPGHPIVRSDPRTRDRPTSLGRQMSPRSRPNQTRTSARRIPRSPKVPTPEFPRSPIAPKKRLTSPSFPAPGSVPVSVQEMNRAKVLAAGPERDLAPAQVVGPGRDPAAGPGKVPAGGPAQGQGMVPAP
jgi:hypothetical protein